MIPGNKLQNVRRSSVHLTHLFQASKVQGCVASMNDLANVVPQRKSRLTSRCKGNRSSAGVSGRPLLAIIGLMMTLALGCGQENGKTDKSTEDYPGASKLELMRPIVDRVEGLGRLFPIEPNSNRTVSDSLEAVELATQFGGNVYFVEFDATHDGKQCGLWIIPITPSKKADEPPSCILLLESRQDKPLPNVIELVSLTDFTSCKQSSEHRGEGAYKLPLSQLNSLLAADAEALYLVGDGELLARLEHLETIRECLTEIKSHAAGIDP